MRKIVVSPPSSEKDENGIYRKVPEPPTPAPTPLSDLSIDDELAKGLLAIHRLMKQVLQDITASIHDKDTVYYLKTCMELLKSLKESEDAILDDMSTEDLEKASE